MLLQTLHTFSTNKQQQEEEKRLVSVPFFLITRDTRDTDTLLADDEMRMVDKFYRSNNVLTQVCTLLTDFRVKSVF